MKKLLVILVVFISSVSALQAQKVAVVTDNTPGWQKIGETSVDFKADHDVITVIGADAFKSLRLKATDAPIHIESMQVVFENGEPQNIPVRYDFKKGTESRSIDLQGNKRKIKQIDFVYNTVPNFKAEKAHLEVWGKK